MLVEFGGIFRLTEFSGFLGCGVDFNRNFKPVDFNRFFRLWFGAKMIYYKAFLFVTRGGK